MIERDGWPKPLVVSDELQENLIQSETDELLQIIEGRRATSGSSGALDDDELHEAYLRRSDAALNFMLARLKAGTPHPIREAMIEMMEQGHVDLARLRNNPTEEDVAEVSERLAAQFRDFDIEGTMRKYKDWADENEEE